jgi:hypothetical protein
VRPPVMADTIVCIALLVAGFCVGSTLLDCVGSAPLAHRPRAQSWDQENLHELGHHNRDELCPWAIYIAPKGELEQCM